MMGSRFVPTAEIHVAQATQLETSMFLLISLDTDRKG